jgi:hypothetical protein
VPASPSPPPSGRSKRLCEFVGDLDASLRKKGVTIPTMDVIIEDVEKYSNLAKAKYLTHTIDRAPLYAGERITYEKFGESSYRSREIKEAFDVLERALIIHRARPST